MTRPPSHATMEPHARREALRIAVVLGPFLPTPPGPAGAIERRWTGMAERFAQRGHTVTLLSRRWTDLRDEETVRGVRHVRCGGFSRTSRRGRDLAKDLLYSFRVRKRLPPADVVVTNVFWLPALLTRWPWGGGRRARVVVNVARMPEGQLFLYGRADRLACVSRALAEAVTRQRPGDGARVRVIPNPIETDVFQPPAHDADHRFAHQRRVILYAGRVHPEKGLALLIDAFARLHPAHPQAVLRLMGPVRTDQGGGGEPYLRQLQKQAGDAPVEFHAPIYDRGDLARQMYDADIFCYPSLAEKGESFGIAPLEAMATGLPTVVSDLACFREFLTDGETGVAFDHRGPDAPEHLRQALDRLLSAPELARDIGARAAQRAGAFSYDRIADLYLADFYELLGRSSNR